MDGSDVLKAVATPPGSAEIGIWSVGGKASSEGHLHEIWVKI